MIKKLIIALLLTLPISAVAQKFGIVDVDQVFAAMPEAKAAQDELIKTSQKFEEEYGKLQEEVNKLYTEFQSIQNDEQTPQSIKERRAQEISEKAQNIDKFRQIAEQELAQKRETLFAPIQSKLTDAIKAVGAEGNYTFIFPNAPELLLYTGSDVTDVTAAVKAKLVP